MCTSLIVFASKFIRIRQVTPISWEGTLAPPGEYDLTTRLLRRCGLMSNYFDHLLSLWLLLLEIYILKSEASVCATVCTQSAIAATF